MNLSGYSTLVFDCDGVVLNSNRVKTEAFRNAALPYGEAAADALVAHHIANGGISRYSKFSWFLETIVPEYSPSQIPGQDGPGLEELIACYARLTREGLLSCSISPGLQQLRASMPFVRWLIVSGGDQTELHEVFTERHLFDLFDGGIFGSPRTKDEILTQAFEQSKIIRPALFLGDSKYDHLVSVRHGLDFVFMSGWTEFAEWELYTHQYQLPSVPHILDLLPQALDEQSSIHPEISECH